MKQIALATELKRQRELLHAEPAVCTALTHHYTSSVHPRTTGGIAMIGVARETQAQIPHIPVISGRNLLLQTHTTHA